MARFARVRYDEIYPGIDLVYYGNHGRLEYDFIVAPGVDPGRIRLRFDGARAVTVNDTGGLTVAMSGGEVLQHAPVIYQEFDGERRPVEGGYVRHENGELGFDVAAYDAGRPLVIDPVIVWATYVGGNQLDVVHQMRVAAAGFIYLAGRTLSTTFPTTPGTVDTTFNPSNEDAFVTKLSPDGMSLVYSTYIGGTGSNGTWQLGDSAYNMDVDVFGSVYIVGETHATDFPVTLGAYQTSRGGGIADGYVVKLSPSGSSLEYATYLGGPGFAIATGVAVDVAGQAHVAVRIATHTGPFPTTAGSVDPTPNGDWDAAVAKLSADGSTLLWSTYLGGSAGDNPHAIALDASGNVYVAIRTGSADFPVTAGAFQTVKAGTSSTHDVALAKISPDGGTLGYSTFLGGPGNDFEGRLLVDALGRVHLTGSTAGGFPVTANALQPTYGGGASDAFLTVVSADGSSLEYSTYLGGSGGDGGTNVAFDSAVGGSGSESAFVGLDAADGVYIAGSTTSVNLPVTAGAFQSAFAGGSHDLFAMKLSGFETNQAPAIAVSIDPLVLEGNIAGGYDNGGGLSAGAAGVSATDPNGDEVTLTNDAAAVLPLGDTVVTWTAEDPDGATVEQQQTVRVQDTTGPSVNAPVDIEQEAPSAGGGSVAFVVTATDLVDPAPVVACSHASGSTFPVGTTTVSCTATDASGNETTVSFDVTLTFVPPPAIDFDALIAKIEGMGRTRGAGVAHRENLPGVR
ncbi:MAG: SBBP repeat-containing protein [Vicinamibacterales bacterium]